MLMAALPSAALATALEDLSAAVGAHRRGDMNEAVRFFTQAIDSGELPPGQLAATYVNRGLSYAQAGKFKWAIADYNAAIKMNPKYAAAYNNRGNAHNELGKRNVALADYSKAIELEPRFALAYGNRGNLYNELGEFDKSLADFDTAIRYEPRFPLAYFNRGNAYSGRGLFDLAIADFEIAIRLEPRFSLAYTARAKANSRKGEFDRALDDLDSAIRFRSYDNVPLTIRGNVKFFLGDFAGAAKDYELSLTVGGPTYDAVVWLYLARKRQGKRVGRELFDYVRRVDLRPWPGPIVRFFAGRLTEEKVFEAAKLAKGRAKEDSECEAAFYVGQKYLLQGDAEKAASFFRRAVATRRITSHEYVGARAELKRMGLPE